MNLLVNENGFVSRVRVLIGTFQMSSDETGFGVFTSHNINNHFPSAMSTFPPQVERFIVKQLASDVEPEEIADEVESTFLREVTPSDVRSYCPETDGSALTPELRDLYQIARWDFEGVLDEE